MGGKGRQLASGAFTGQHDGGLPEFLCKLINNTGREAESLPQAGPTWFQNDFLSNSVVISGRSLLNVLQKASKLGKLSCCGFLFCYLAFRESG